MITVNQNDTGPPGNASTRVSLPGHARGTASNDDRSLELGVVSVKAPVERFIEHRTYASFLEAFPHLLAANSPQPRNGTPSERTRKENT